MGIAFSRRVSSACGAACRMTSSPALSGVATGIVLLASIALSPSPAAARTDLDLAFDMLGPAACETPPPGFDPADLLRLAAREPDSPIARGTVEGATSGVFVGGAVYGQDDASGFALSVQGATTEAGGDSPLLCLLLVRVGAPGAHSGVIVGRDTIDGASRSDFFGAFRLVWTGADGKAALVATGDVDHGDLRLEIDEEGIAAGAVTFVGGFSMPGDDERLPLSARMSIPRAENTLRPVPRVTRRSAASGNAVGACDHPVEDAAAPLRATFRLPPHFPQIPLRWSLTPLCEATQHDATEWQAASPVAEATVPSGTYVVSTTGPGEVAFRATVRISPGWDNDFVIPLVIEAED